MSTLSRITLSTAAAALLSLGGFALPTAAQAQAVINVQIGQAPPPPRFERVPPPRRGYVWAPGHWEWQRGGHVWVGGTWLRARPGYAYHAPQWVERDGRWDYRAGRWDRSGGGGDRDHDGVRNRHDRDRDGDGVPNRYDRKPNNRNRH
ncbi:YXWGXW repeat-containing protein [Xenophilus arseniciresistens]|uniref:YXWGXW repeat-containing protein n=1 Tax=Xenophilus arseniciresistens TaxID=1283306 RepID=A0AAE3NC22_9BURK|nr:YXWGXW repeat-containing protein [Xenophilus arseniciresistens]MDA7418921.1 YXWGXW repeat-containing protein [Xenophilus arseniciresistens]